MATWAAVILALRAPAAAAGPVPLEPGGTPWTAAEVASLNAAVTAALGARSLRGAHLGFYAVDTVRGTVLGAKAPDEGFVPASTLKLVTGSAAVARLGADFRFRTSVLAPALDGDTVHGDLIVRGGGDPLLRASDLDAAAAAIAARGVRTVEGGIAFDVSIFDRVPYAPGWMMEDIPYDFSAIVSGLMLEEDTVVVHVAAGVPGSPASLGLTPLTSAVPLEDAVVSGPPGSEDTVDLARDGAAIRVTGSIPAGKEETLAAAVPDPLAYAADVFARALVAHGVTVASPPGPTPLEAPTPTATLLWFHDSDPLARMLQWFWYRSDNLVGESLLKALGAATRGAPGTSAAGIAFESSFLRSAGIDPTALAIVDGSGLSRYDAVTPRTYVTLLQSDWNGPDRRIFVDALPVAGVRGSLARTFLGTPAEGRLYAKSGSMTHVWNLAGYVMTRRHGPVTFALLSDDFTGNVDALIAVESELFARIVDG